MEIPKYPAHHSVGAQALGLRTDARVLADETLDLVRSAGICEYYHAYTGAGLGGSEFT